MHNEPTKIEVSEDLENAYETGNWMESWTEQGDTTKSELKGKYWIMYVRRKDKNWCIQFSHFFTVDLQGKLL